jgi:hypothetical protein
MGILQHSVERWPSSLGTAYAVVGVFFDDPEPALICELAQLIELVLWVLINSRDTHVKSGTLH